MKMLLLILPLALMACQPTPSTLYLSSIETANAAVASANVYIADCEEKPKTDGCYGSREKLKDAVAITKATSQEAHRLYRGGNEALLSVSLDKLAVYVASIKAITKE